MALDALLHKIDMLNAKRRALKPLGPSELAQLRDYYRIGLTYASNALEGNSLTESETKVVIENGITIGGKPLRDHLEAQGHAAAFDQMWAYTGRDVSLTENTIRELHRLFYEKIDSANAGVYRTVRVFLSGSATKLPDPQEVPRLMSAFVDTLPEFQAGHHPVITAAHIHKSIAAIHPFVDGNGRTARLAMNLELVRHDFPVAIIPPVLRVSYLDAIRVSDSGNDIPFFELVAQMVIESLQDHIRLLS